LVEWTPEGRVELELAARHALHLLAETLERLLQLVPQLALSLERKKIIVSSNEFLNFTKKLAQILAFSTQNTDTSAEKITIR
jgi:hypothetical protein